VLLPVVDINVGHSSDQELQLSLIKDVDELLGDEFVEAGHERLELLLDSFRDSVLGDRTNAHPKGTDQRNCVAHAPRKTASEWREREREKGRGEEEGTYSTYSFLLSSVTSMFSPPGMSGIEMSSPNRSSSVENVFSMTSVMSLSLGKKGRKNETLVSLRIKKNEKRERERSGEWEGKGDKQHPLETSVELGVDGLEVLEDNLLLEDHLVEGDDEVGVEEPTMEDAEAEASSDELEVWIG
jgi:hypothetical protein